MDGSDTTTTPTMSCPPPPAPPRHWPLDLPSGLPFERYEHRRLTARDILVHRIMTAVFAPLNHPPTDQSLEAQPASSLSAALAAPREPSPRLEVARTYRTRHNPGVQPRMCIPYHNFAGLKVADRLLARDVEVLRKMLVTRSASEWVQQDLIKPAKAVAAWPGVRPPMTSFWERERGPPPPEQRPTVQDEVLDLVRMHYLQMDDPATRLWLGMVETPRRTGYETLPKKMAKRDSHKHLVQQRVAWQERNMADDYKRWYPDETAHLKALQRQTHVANERPLYEGGAFLPRLQRKVMESKVVRAKYLSNMTEARKQSYFTEEHNGYKIQGEIYPWPEADAPRRVLHAPSVYSWRQKQHFFRDDMPPVDFASGRVGRGLDRDGIWSTSRWYGDDVPRGRTVRRERRRAVSEPPPGTFTTARLPVSFNSSRELLIFPKMSLITMERRARRRSLSRTRIAEMFNWDITLEDPPPKPPVQPQLTYLLASAASHTCSVKRLAHLAGLDLIQQPMPYTEKHSSLWGELYYKLAQNRLFPSAIIESARAAILNTEHDIWHYPKWMSKVDVGEHLEMSEDTKANDGMQTVLRLDIPQSASPSESTPICTNCASTYHKTDKCCLPCGYCGAPNPSLDYKYLDVARNRYIFSSDDDDNAPKAGNHDNPHLASNCPVARQNRCKCTPFPQFHPAAKCLVLCSRPCGNTTHPPGHFKHRNAMGCKSRCCMCGMKGHSGTKCKFKTCRCGGTHLGQDCAWHPACRVERCGRFHCGVHCRACGVDRNEAGAVLLVDGLCAACGEGGGVSSSCAEAGGKSKSSSRRRNKRSSRADPRKAGKEVEKTWYTPLEPRTRPLVGVKSGKSAARRGGVDGLAEVRIGGCR